MNRFLVFSLIALFIMSVSLNACAYSSSKEVSVKAKMTLDEFKALWEKEGKTPEGAVKCLIIAALETVKEGNKDGKKMWGMVLPKDYVTGSGEPDTTQRTAIEQFGRQIKGTNFNGAIAASYLGGTPENGYTYSYDNNVDLVQGQGKIGESEAKIFVKSGGKDNPSPVILKKNKDGYWKVFEYSSLFTGVKPIQTNDF